MPLFKFRTIWVLTQCQRNLAAVGYLNTVRCYAATQRTNQKLSDDTAKEVEHHAKLAKEWWDVNGPMRALHSLNEVRVPFIRDGLVARGNISSDLVNTTNVLKDQKILDVGCGAGILTEQLGRLGAYVTGIDLGDEVIKTASEHLSSKAPSILRDRITYKVESIESHAKQRLNYYDAVVVAEVIEHVTDKIGFLTPCVQTLRPGGSIFISTFNKTVPLWISAILLGEYVFNFIPRGTHHWHKLISPLDVQRILDTLNCRTVLVNGATYEFWRNHWRWINSANLWYALQAVKSDIS